MPRNTFDDIKVKDQLGKPDEFGLFGPFKRTEEILVEEGPTVVTQASLVAPVFGFLYDSGEFGMLGENILGFPDSTPAIIEVTSPNDTFVWRFRYTSSSDFSAYGDTVALGMTDLTQTTASEDATTNFRIDFTNGELWTSRPIFKTQDTGITVTTITLGTTQSGTLAWQATANGGTNWENITVGTTHAFAHPGRDVRIRATSTGASTLSVVRVQYTR